MDSEEKEFVVKILDKGPAFINTEVKIIMPDGTVEIKKPVALCRCSKSKSQPYCDGSHAKDEKQ